jgi:hypothetical protein
MLDNLVCPISNVRIDRNVVRTNGLITTLLLLAYVLTLQPWIIVPVGLDYVLRTLMRGPTSPMTLLAREVARRLRLPYRAMDKAPKVFASRIGVCFAMGAAVAHFIAPAVAPWLAGALAVFTTLESVFDLCVGCVVYTYVALPLYRAREAVKSIPLFGNLEEPMLASVAEGFHALELPAGARILTEGSPGAEMYVIRAGEVAVYHEGADGQRSVLAIYKPRQHFGEMALLTGNPRNASVSAVTPVTLLRLLRTDLEQLFQKHSGMRAILERAAAERMALEASSKGP